MDLMTAPRSRRDIMRLLGGLGAAAALPSMTACGDSGGAAIEIPVIGDGGNPFSGLDAAGAEAIGRAYLQGPGDGATADSLSARVFSGSADIDALQVRAREDFEAGRLFTYQGWRLSDTEGALFALVALTPA